LSAPVRMLPAIGLGAGGGQDADEQVNTDFGWTVHHQFRDLRGLKEVPSGFRILL